MRDPRPPLVLAAALVTVALATSQPLVVAGALAGSILLLVQAPGTHRPLIGFALVSGLLLWALNPFVSAEGQQVLVPGAHHLVIDFEITVEELIRGFVGGARLATAIIAVGAFLAFADPDRVQELASRVAPRSTLTVALAARLAPALRRDAVAMREALVLRGVGTAIGRTARLRQTGALVEPLVTASLERGVEASEALAARGHGLARPTALPRSPLDHRERLVLLLGAVAAAIALTAIVGVYAYAPGPFAPPVVSPAAIAAALGLLLIGLGSGRLLGDGR